MAGNWLPAAATRRRASDCPAGQGLPEKRPLRPIGGRAIPCVALVDGTTAGIQKSAPLVQGDPSAILGPEHDVWCSRPNLRGTRVCLHEQVLFTRLTGPFLSLNGWYLARSPGAAAAPGWQGAEPTRGASLPQDPGWQLYFMDD